MEEPVNMNDDMILDPEELAIEGNFDSWVSLRTEEKTGLLSELRGAVIRKPVTVRMDVQDIDALKRLAELEGLPYQTLLGSVIHKYVVGNLVDLNEARKVLRRA
jgi:predicted DNA binding CopG/RHH family protein